MFLSLDKYDTRWEGAQRHHLDLRARQSSSVIVSVDVCIDSQRFFVIFHQEAMTEQMGRDSSTDMQYSKCIYINPRNPYNQSRQLRSEK
jgi:hypothetical protein